MRAVRLPATMAVCAEPRSHYIITAVDSSRSFQRCKQQQENSKGCGYSLRLARLLPADWTNLLELCCVLTHPQKSFSFSSPGDGGPSPGTASAAENGAYLHVVERAAGDFVPNNLIYHCLRRYTLNAQEGCVEGFGQLVREAQSLPAQSAAEAAVCVVRSCDEPVLSAEERAALDPLAAVDEAKAKSAANALMDVWADTKDTEHPQVFVFYPFACPVASSVPYRSRHFCVMVNLKPIVPNHLMVVPLRCVGTVHALTHEEREDWGRTVALTIRVLDEVRRRTPTERGAAPPPRGGPSPAASSPPSSSSEAVGAAEDGDYSIAVQQGVLAGQTVPHLHTHVIPFDPNGKLAGEPECEEAEQQSRPPRTTAVMKRETDDLKRLFKDLERTL